MIIFSLNDSSGKIRRVFILLYDSVFNVDLINNLDVDVMKIDTINVLKRGVEERVCLLSVTQASLNRLGQAWGI